MPRLASGYLAPEEERQVALVLKRYIENAFGNAFEVFAAFDKESIGGGKKWFTHIAENLRKSRLIFVLVSAASRRRQWLAFEAGFGDGVNAVVIPIGIRTFSWKTLDFPLAGFQGRDIGDLPSILADVANALGLSSERQDLDAYLNEIGSAEADMAYKSLTVRPFVSDSRLHFEIENSGNTDIELVMLEVWIPVKCLYGPWGQRPPDQFVTTYMHVEAKWRNGIEYRWFACTSNRGAFGSKPGSLRPIITPAMGVTSVLGMDIPLSRELPRDIPELGSGFPRSSQRAGHQLPEDPRLFGGTSQIASMRSGRRPVTGWTCR